jgi:hypothetical protein
MNKLLNEGIVEKYPKFFPLPENPRTLKDAFFHFRCDDGWYDLINSCCNTINHYLKNHKQPPAFHFTQIKEKFGGLRMYYECGDPFIEGIIHFTESVSYKICEETGKPGKLYAKPTGWIKTLCRENAVGYIEYVSKDVG